MERLNDGLDLGSEENEWMKNDSWVFILNYPQGNGAIANVGKSTEEQVGSRRKWGKAPLMAFEQPIR